MQTVTGGSLDNFTHSVLTGPVQKNGYQVIQSKTKSLMRELSTVEDPGAFRLNAESLFSGGQSYVDLNWNAVPNTMDGYIVERTNDNVNWVIPPTNYGKRVRILNVHPNNGNFLASWMNQDNGTGTPVSMNLIDVIPISTTDFINRFNSDPNGGLKDSSGNYQYDGIYFGSADGNNGEDINRVDVINALKAFGKTGRSLVFGHDTVMSHYHSGFNSFASELGIKLLPAIDDNSINDDRIGSNLIHFTPESVDGYLYRYPYFLDPAQTYVIKPSHTGGQFYLYNDGGRKWMSYKSPYYFPYFEPSVGVPTNVHYLDKSGNRAWDDNGQRIGDDNAYLVTKNNYAIIQTGHSTGACTPDEAKVIANMIYYTSTLNTTTHGEDHTVKDSTAPDTPTAVATGTITNDVTLNINTQDNGTNYYYRVKAKNQ